MHGADILAPGRVCCAERPAKLRVARGLAEALRYFRSRLSLAAAPAEAQVVRLAVVHALLDGLKRSPPGSRTGVCRFTTTKPTAVLTANGQH